MASETRDEARIALLGLFHSYHLSGSEEEKATKFDVYWSILAGVEPREVVQVCRRAFEGQVGENLAYLPSLPELMADIRAHRFAPPKPAAGTGYRLPPPKPMTPDEREKDNERRRKAIEREFLNGKFRWEGSS